MTHATLLHVRRWPAIATLCCALAACGNQPPAADWALNADSAAERATQAYLRGDARVQALEWSKARSEVERTARPQLIARLALMRCAAEQASLDWKECGDYAAVAVDAEAAEQAYAAYLQTRPLSVQDIALLPAAQQPVARALGEPGAALAAVKAVKEPLSRLVAASVVLRAQGPSDGLLAEAVDTASSQGWRRPLLAWLLLHIGQARKAGDERQVQALERRVQVLQGAGSTGAAVQGPAR
ncbi:hypothetical protein [Comamonas endophytica]|uniref:Lipoprotein n=1 Tax=Comamonas endophytica TaxID=2949090 RepID=A0ABY6GAJ0_9BURK|nr:MULTISPECIES: hypothetical protein [unclassified Acidovorax]MCD2512101.1 hypothetical protein [Acidovorax sp. D4N7]UYG51878.1 hypothetical protein M9799_01080 [Acidovorax sp. 5MLIR]